MGHSFMINSTSQVKTIKIKITKILIEVYLLSYK